MDRYEHVGAMLPRDRGALPEADVVVAIAHHDRAEPVRPIDAIPEAARDRKHHVLFINPALADRPGILAAVTRVHGHDHVPQPLRHARRGGGALGFRHEEVHHQAMPIRRHRLEREVLRPHFARDIEHDPVRTARTPAAAYPLDDVAPGRRRLEPPLEARVAEIDDHPAGAFEQEDVVLDGGARIEDDPGVVRRLVHADAFEFRPVHGPRATRRRKHARARPGGRARSDDGRPVQATCPRPQS